MDAAFLLVRRKSGRTLAPGARQLIESAAPPQLAFTPNSHDTWASPDGATLVGVWQAQHPFLGGERRWRAGPSGVAMVVGSLWSASTWMPLDEWFAAPLGGDGRRGLFARLDVDAAGSATIGADPLGLRLVYHGESDEAVAVGSRAALVAWALSGGRRPAPDPVSAGWLAFSRYTIGERSGYEGVKVLRPGCLAHVSAQGLRIESLPQPWDRPERPGDRLADVAADIGDVLEASLDAPCARHVVDLTGGKDSRLLLALLAERSLTARAEFLTVGPPDLADVQVATELAALLGLRHRVEPTLPHHELPYDEMLVEFVARTGGMTSIWDARRRTDPDDSVRVQGLPGEMLRTYQAVPRDLRTDDQLRSFFEQRVLRSQTQLLRPEALDLFRQAAVEELFHPMVTLAPPERLHAYFLRNRVRFSRYGPLEETNVHARVHPLYSLTGLTSALHRGAEAREAERLHADLIRRASPELFRHRFAGPGWPHGPVTAPAAGGPAPAPPAAKAESLMAKARRTSFESRRGIFGDILGDTNSAAWNLLDREKVMRAFDDFGSLKPLGRQELHGAITAVLWLGASAPL